MSVDNENTEAIFDDYLSMSDEDFNNIPANEMFDEKEESFEEEEEQEHNDEQEDESESDGDLEEQDEDEAEDDNEEYEEEEYAAEEEEEDNEEDPFDGEDEESDEDTEAEEDDEDEVEESESDDNDTNYKAKYEELMAPFKANKKEIKVDTPEELRRLAQMGVGFNAKMAEIKPLRKIGKMLENAGLLDESKVNYLIDLSKNDQGAINKLIKDSGIDPLDLDEESTDYTPNTYNVNDDALELSDTLDSLQESESGIKVISEVDTKWDDASKEVLLQNPNLFNNLSRDVDNGTYDKIMNILEKERTLGNVPKGVNDLQAYTHIFKILSEQEQPEQKQEEPKAKPKAVKPKVIRKKSDTKRNKLRQAAASTRGKATKKNVDGLDILGMSDEEFEKQFY